MPRIPTYSAQGSLDTDRGGMPRLRSADPLGSALKGLGKAVASLPGPGDQAAQKRRKERQQAREAFGRVRAVLDAQTALKEGLVARREGIKPDGAGFYEAYSKDVVEPELAKAVAAFPPEEQPAVRDIILARAEPILQQAAETERGQSIVYYEAETDRLAAGILDDVDLSMPSFQNAREQLDELVSLSVLPRDRALQLALRFDKELARTVASRFAASEPEQLLDGMLGFRTAGGDTEAGSGGEEGSYPRPRLRDIARSLSGDDDAAPVVERFMARAFGRPGTAEMAGRMAVATAAFLAPEPPYQPGDWAKATEHPRRGDLVLLPEGGVGLFDRVADGGRSLVLIHSGDGTQTLRPYDRQELEFLRVARIPPDRFDAMAEAGRTAFGLREEVAVSEPDPRLLALPLAERLILLAELNKPNSPGPASEQSGPEASESNDGWEDLGDGVRIRRTG